MTVQTPKKTTNADVKSDSLIADDGEKGHSDKNFGEMVTPFAMFRDSNKTRQA